VAKSKSTDESVADPVKASVEELKESAPVDNTEELIKVIVINHSQEMPETYSCHVRNLKGTRTYTVQARGKNQHKMTKQSLEDFQTLVSEKHPNLTVRAL